MEFLKVVQLVGAAVGTPCDEREKGGINRKYMWDKHRAEYIQKETKQST